MGLEKQGAKPTGLFGKIIGRLMNKFHTSLYVDYFKDILPKDNSKIKKLIFVTCCGSTFEGRDEKFGYNLVFNLLRNLAGEKCVHCEAFPISLVLTDEQKKDSDADMKYHLNKENFKKEIITIYDPFIQKIKDL